jgi:hypothetical protein
MADNPEFHKENPETGEPLFEVGLNDVDTFLKRYELSRLSSTILERLTILVLSASGFIAALAWDDALKAFFREVVLQNASISGKFFYAIFVTVIAVLLSVFLSKKIIAKRKKKLFSTDTVDEGK